jgi:hypothetical protein
MLSCKLLLNLLVTVKLGLMCLMQLRCQELLQCALYVSVCQQPDPGARWHSVWC